MENLQAIYEKELYEKLTTLSLIKPYIVKPNENDLKEYSKNFKIKGIEKYCEICGIKFYYGDSRVKTCGCCKIVYQCPQCNKINENIIRLGELNRRKIPVLRNLAKENKIENFFNFCNSFCSQKFIGNLPYMRKSRSESNLKYRKENHEKAKKQFEICKNGYYNWRRDNPEDARKTSMIGIKSMLKWQENNPEKSKIQRKEACKSMSKKIIDLWENDKEWAENQKKISLRNLEKAKQVKIQKLKKLFEENPIQFNSQLISFEKLQELKQNDICGSWVIKEKFKAYKGTNRENEIFKLGPFKSVKVYNEMYWAFRVISQPQKQDMFNIDWTIAKWWYIANLYYDFEFEIITDKKGVSEEEALIIEAAYASKYNLFVKFTKDEEGRRIPIVEKHAYWNP